MTWLNALFNLTVVALAGLVEWGRHRLETWSKKRKGAR